MHRNRRTLMVLLWVALAAWGCNRTKTEEEAVADVIGGDAALDPREFANNAGVRARVLGMPFNDAAKALGSLNFASHSSFHFTTDHDALHTSNTTRVTRDGDGGTRIELSSGRDSVTILVQDKTIYVRHGLGDMRKRGAEDAPIAMWQELAFSDLRQALEPFAARVSFGKPVAGHTDGRPTVSVSLTLGQQRSAESPWIDPTQLPRSPLPVAPAAAWRGMVRPLDLKGEIVIDAQTGAVLRSKLDGRVEINDRDIRPTELVVHQDGSIRDIGHVARIQAPEHRDEYVITPPEIDPLEFFRARLPAVPAPTPTNAASARAP